MDKVLAYNNHVVINNNNSFYINTTPPQGQGKIRNITKNKDYLWLQDAFEDADAGDSLSLLGDITDEDILIDEKGVTLNINGHSITRAKMLWTNGEIIDNTTYTTPGSLGYVKAQAYKFKDIRKVSQASGTNKYMPIYDSSVDGFRFVSLRFTTSSGFISLVGSDLKFNLAASVAYEYAINLLANDYKRHDHFKPCVLITWEQHNDDGTVTNTSMLSYTNAVIDYAFASPKTRMFTATIRGVNEIAIVQPVFISYDNNGNTLMTLYGPEFTYNPPVQSILMKASSREVTESDSLKTSSEYSASATI